MTIRALLFDLWGTLIHVDDLEGDPNRRRMAYVDHLVATLAEIGVPHPAKAVDTALNVVLKEMGARHDQGRDLSAPEHLERLLDVLQPRLPAELSREQLGRLEDGLTWAVRKYPPRRAEGALDALMEARSRELGIGLVSITGRTPGYVLRQVLDEHDFLGYLDVMTFSDKARLAKPAEAV